MSDPNKPVDPKNPFSGLSDHEWNVAKDMWGKGLDKWLAPTAAPSGALPQWRVKIPGVSFPQYTRRSGAYKAVTGPILEETRRRLGLKDEG